MAQPSVSSFFITRKRGLEDDVIANKNKVICLERTSNSSESRDGFTDSEEFGTQVVFPKIRDSEISKNEVPQKIAKISSAVRQGITPQRMTRSKKVHMQEVDGIQTPKIVNFWKGGNLSPQKKAKSAIVETVITPTTCELERKIVKGQGMSTPVKLNATKGPDTIEKTSLISSNGMKADDIKKKLKGSLKLADLKTRINQLNNGLDRLDQMEKKRLASGTSKDKLEATNGTPKSLKPFKTIELEIMSPSKRLSSPMKLKDSPMKNTLMGSPKIMTPKRLFSPTKSSPLKMSPVKAPAHQRFQHLIEQGTPTLQLPFKYRYLLEIFKAVDTVCAMFFNRKEKITFKKLKPAVQRILRKNFLESHLAQLQYLLPEAYKFAQEKTRNFGSTSKADYYQMVITPNIGTAHDDVKQLTLSPQILIERTKKLTEILIDLVFAEHQKFLQTLEVPMNVTRGALKRWHPEFDLEKVPDISLGDLPMPPNVEKFSSAKAVLSTARNLFHCATPMERAMERLEEKKKEEMAKIKESEAPATENMTKKLPAPAQTPTSSVLKGVPKSLLDKIRAKQAAKALDTMTRRPSQEREAVKYARLPEIARHARNVFVTEKKGVLPVENVLKKIENSYKGSVTMKEVEELLKLIAQVMPAWLSFHEIRFAIYVKLSRDSDLAAVVNKLEKLAAEKSKIN